MIYGDIASLIGISLWLLIVLLAWSLVWKAIALWKSARKGNLVWFILLLVINTAGILEILYIFIFSKLGKKERQKVKRKTAKKPIKK